METYVDLRYNTVAYFISTRPIIDLCLAVEGLPGEQFSQWWWEKEFLDLEGMWAASRAVNIASREEGEEGDKQ